MQGRGPEAAPEALDRGRSAERTGPIGRIARLAWAAVFLGSLASIVGPRGSAQFRNPQILTEPSAWVLHLAMLAIFVILIGSVVNALGGDARLAQVAALGAVLVGITVAGITAWLTGGAVWGFPLADAVWVFDVAMLVEQLIAFGLVIALGTPGCEIGIWAALIARMRDERASTTDGVACLVGLQLIDRWEAGRRSRRS